MDDRCNTDNSVGTWAGEQLHDGWVHPYFACDRNCCGIDQGHSGAKNPLADERSQTRPGRDRLCTYERVL